MDAHSNISPTNVYQTSELAAAGILARIFDCIVDSYQTDCFSGYTPSGAEVISVYQTTGQISLSYSGFFSCGINVPDIPGGTVCTMNGCYTPTSTLNIATSNSTLTISLNLKAGSILTLTSSFVITWGVNAHFSPNLVRCTGGSISYSSYSNTTDSFGYVIGEVYTYNIIEDNVYILTSNLGIVCYNTLSVAGAASYIITSTDTITANPAIALYVNPSDPTTPLELEACPKLTLPLPDSGSPYYLFLADAQSALDLFVSNCVGYCALGNTPGAHFTATDGGTTLTLDAGITTSYTDPGCTSDEQAGFEVAGSVSVQPTSTLHCDYSISGSFTQNGTSTVTGFIVEFVVFDQDNQFYDSNTIILSSSGGSGTQDFSITTAGKYTVITRFEITTSCLHPGGAFAYTINGNTVLYSDMTMTINPAEALYRNLGNCVSHLDCTP